jgi:uncharacterized protein YlxW (UPF0749 family)
MGTMPAHARGTSTGRSPVAAAGRRDASMVLLTSLVEDSLDQGYARAAARRAAGERPPRHGRLVLTAGLLAVGLLLATAAAQTRDRAAATAQARAALAEEIEDRTAANERLERTLDRQRAAVSRARRAALGISAEGVRLDRLLARLESSTGAAAVRGPGMSLLLEEAGSEAGGADVDPRTDDDADSRVTDRDLQTLVNEIWAAGAEAVAVNEQRLTSLSAIRAAGDAILVDFRPLNPPYEVRAIGPTDMRTTFVQGFGGSYLQVLRDYGIDFSVEDRDELVLPASAGLTVRYTTTPADVLSGATGSTATPEPPEPSQNSRERTP